MVVVKFGLLSIILGLGVSALGTDGPAKLDSRFVLSAHKKEKERVICYVSKSMVYQIRRMIERQANGMYTVTEKGPVSVETLKFNVGSRFAPFEERELDIPLDVKTEEEPDEKDLLTKKLSYLEKAFQNLQDLEYQQCRLDSLLEKRGLLQQLLNKHGEKMIEGYYANEDEIVKTITSINRLIRIFELQFSFRMIDLAKKLEEAFQKKKQKQTAQTEKTAEAKVSQ